MELKKATAREMAAMVLLMLFGINEEQQRHQKKATTCTNQGPIGTNAESGDNQAEILAGSFMIPLAVPIPSPMKNIVIE